MTNYTLNRINNSSKNKTWQDFFESMSKRVLLAGMFVALIVVYVVQVGITSTKGYEINSLQNKITDLKREKQRIEYEIAKAGSLQTIQTKLQKTNLVAVGNDVEYLVVNKKAVAKR